MSKLKETPLTKSNFNTIFHPFLLKTFTTKSNDYAIIPKYIGSEIIDDWKNFSNVKTQPENFELNLDLNDYYTSDEFFLCANLQINSIDQIYQKIDDLIASGRKLQTVDFILNIIFNTFKNELDDIAIDKIVDFYKKYFHVYFSKQIDYQIMFKQIQTQSQSQTKFSHTIIVNNILKK